MIYGAHIGELNTTFLTAISRAETYGSDTLPWCVESCRVRFPGECKSFEIVIAMLQLRLLGRFDLRRDDGTAVSLPGRQSMAVLACLGLADDFTVARERLAELVWAGRGAEQANGSLRQELVRLRRTIGEEVLPGAGTTSQPVRLDVTDVDIDVVRFRRAAAAPGGGPEAIALYRGPLLQDFPLRPRDPFGEWIAVHRVVQPSDQLSQIVESVVAQFQPSRRVA